MKEILKITLLVLFGVAFIGTFVFLYKKSQKKPDDWATEQIFKSTIEQKTVVTGKVEPRQEIEIKPQINGIIQELYVQPGKFVNEGDVIARIKVIPEMYQLEQAKSNLKTSEINLNDSKRIYEKNKELYGKKVISEVDFMQYETKFLNAQENYEAAIKSVQIIEKGAISSADKNTNTLVRSTASGMILNVPVERGNSVIQSNNFNAGTTVASVANMGDMIFKGKIDEAEVGKLKKGMPLKISIGALQDVKLEADLEYISPKGIEEQGAIQFEIKANVKMKKDVFVRAGYSSNADIILDRRDSVMAIKESWVKYEKEKPYVEVETKKLQVFEKRFVKLGLSDGVNIELISGLKKGDKIKTINKSLIQEIKK